MRSVGALKEEIAHLQGDVRSVGALKEEIAHLQGDVRSVGALKEEIAQLRRDMRKIHRRMHPCIAGHSGKWFLTPLGGVFLRFLYRSVLTTPTSLCRVLWILAPSVLGACGGGVPNARERLAGEGGKSGGCAR